MAGMVSQAGSEEVVLVLLPPHTHKSVFRC